MIIRNCCDVFLAFSARVFRMLVEFWELVHCLRMWEGLGERREIFLFGRNLVGWSFPSFGNFYVL